MQNWKNNYNIEQGNGVQQFPYKHHKHILQVQTE